DARVTRPDHPLAKYAEVFTQKFDLIAERLSVVNQLREVAKASILAKYLIDSGVQLDDSWFNLASAFEGSKVTKVPQLWNERYHAKVQVQDGTIDEEALNPRMHGVYGGVQFGLEKFTVGARAASASVQFARVGARGPMPRVSAALSMATSVTGGLRTPAMRAAVSMRAGGVPRGVQFGLEKFTVGARAASASVQFARVGARGPMPRVSAALSMATSVTGGLRTPAMRAAVSMRAGGVPRGVQFGLEKFTVGARAASASVQFARVGARGPMPRVSAALSMATSVTGGLRTPAMRAAVSMRAGGVPRGVQFGLEKFTVGARAASASVQFARVGARGPMPRVSAALSMATSVTGGLRTPAMRAAVSMRAGGVPRGVDRCPPRKSCSEAGRSSEMILADAGSAPPMGSSFWQMIDDSEETVLSSKDTTRSCCAPCSTRASPTGAWTVTSSCPRPPATRTRRSCAPSSGRRQPCRSSASATSAAPSSRRSNAGSLFPFSWQESFQAQAQGPRRCLVPRADLLQQAGELAEALETAAPSFDKLTEEGSRFRAYRFGGLEVRTYQDADGPETVGAILAQRA
ncbi:unnamed protein product, partial [Prorocentrum cordatum]